MVSKKQLNISKESSDKPSFEDRSVTGSNITRREFIKKSLKRGAGVYVSMTVIDAFVGSKIGINGMPAHAVSVAACW